AAGVPVILPALKLSPRGRVPDSVNVGVGVPVAVNVNDPAVPTLKVALFALVICGAVFVIDGFIVSVKFWVASGATPLLAVIVTGKLPVCVGVPLSTPLNKSSVTPL